MRVKNKENLQIVKFLFTGPLHLGIDTGSFYDKSDTIIHSDTISGAIASSYVTLYGESNVKDFMQQFYVSSAFPFYHENYFFPKPMMRILFDFDKSDAQLGKMIKKLKYIHGNIFSHLIKGETVPVTEEMFGNNGEFLWNASEHPDNFIKSDIQQRVIVPRDNQGESLPYYVDRLHFRDNAGFYFFLHTDKEETLRQIKACLHFLGDQGIGTDKSSGNGQFIPDVKDVDELKMTWPDTGDKSLLLSLYCPTRDEIDKQVMNNSNYLLTNRNAFIAGTSENKFRHLRTKSIYMFTEGSVMGNTQPEGKITDVKPDWNDPELHPVYRDGRGFVISVVENQSES